MFGGKYTDRDILKDINKKSNRLIPVILLIIAVVLLAAVIIYTQLFKDKGIVQTIAENVLSSGRSDPVISTQSAPEKPSLESLDLLTIADNVYLDSANMRVILDKDGIKAKALSIKNDYARRLYEIEAGIENSGQMFSTDDFELVFTEEASVKMISKQLYLTETTEDEYYFYVHFFDPRDKYKKILVLDPGHGGEDVGANIGVIYEKDIDLKIAKMVYDRIEADTENGIKAIMTRDDDSFLSLEERVRIANEVADVFVSIHSNTYEKDTAISGVQTHFLPNFTALKSEKLAENIQKHVIELTLARDRGTDKTNSFYVVNHTLAPSVLIETGYMTNPEELDKLLDDDYLEKVAEGIYRGIVESCEGISFRDKDFFGESFCD